VDATVEARVEAAEARVEATLAALPTTTPTATPTAIPTSTAVPTSTPVPTATVVPTVTPSPTPTDAPPTPIPTPVPPTPIPWAFFATGGYSLQYPVGWQVDDSEASSYTSYVQIRDPSTWAEFSIEISGLYSVILFNETTWNYRLSRLNPVFVDQSVTPSFYVLPESGIVPEGVLVYKARPAMWLSYAENTTHDCTWYVTLLTFVKQQRFVTLGTGVCEEYLDEFAPIFAEILDNFSP